MGRRSPFLQVIVALSCSPRSSAPSVAPGPAASAPERATGPSERGAATPPGRFVGRYLGDLWPYAIEFELPSGVELVHKGDGYAWASAEESAAMAVFAGPFSRDEITTASIDDLPAAMAEVVIAGVGGNATQLVERHRLEAPAEIEAAGWRFAAPGLSGWVAVYVAKRKPAAGARVLGDVFFIVVLGPAASRHAFGGAAVATIRDSIRFAPL